MVRLQCWHCTGLLLAAAVLHEAAAPAVGRTARTKKNKARTKLRTAAGWPAGRLHRQPPAGANVSEPFEVSPT